MKKWVVVFIGIIGVDGRRIDVVVFGEGWEVCLMELKIEGKWSVYEY